MPFSSSRTQIILVYEEMSHGTRGSWKEEKIAVA